MEREEEWQEQGGGEQSTEGGPTGVDPDDASGGDELDVDGPNESAPGSGDEEKDFPTDAA